MTDERRIAVAGEEGPSNRIIVSISGEDEFLRYQDYGLTFESTEQQVLEAIRGTILEKYGADLKDASGRWLYKMRKATQRQNLHIIPNSVAGLV